MLGKPPSSRISYFHGDFCGAAKEAADINFFCVDVIMFTKKIHHDLGGFPNNCPCQFCVKLGQTIRIHDDRLLLASD
jgi:hypothetical protein